MNLLPTEGGEGGGGGEGKKGEKGLNRMSTQYRKSTRSQCQIVE